MGRGLDREGRAGAGSLQKVCDRQQCAAERKCGAGGGGGVAVGKKGCAGAGGRRTGQGKHQRNICRGVVSTSTIGLKRYLGHTGTNGRVWGWMARASSELSGVQRTSN